MVSSGSSVPGDYVAALYKLYYEQYNKLPNNSPKQETKVSLIGTSLKLRWNKYECDPQLQCQCNTPVCDHSIVKWVVRGVPNAHYCIRKPLHVNEVEEEWHERESWP